MIHFDDGLLRSYLDREPLTRDRGEVTDHLADCVDCRARIAELRRAEGVVGEALALLDGAVPLEAAWERIARGPVAPPRRGAAVVAPWWKSPLARAAGLVLFLGGGAAAAVIPGSPIRSLWDRPGSPPADRAAATAAPEAGIRMARDGERVRVVVTAPAGTALEVTLTEGRAGVFGPPSATFSAQDGILRAESDQGPLRIEIPGHLAEAVVVVNGATVAEIRTGRVVSGPEGTPLALPLRLVVP